MGTRALDIASEIGGPFASDLQVAWEAAQQAADIAMAYFQGDFAIERKAGNEPVTVADRECSEAVVRVLGKHFPDDVLISEELRDDRRRLQVERVWYIDPIDGTKDFIRGRAGFSIMLGLTRGHQPVLGLVYQPCTGSLFLAARDSGSWLYREGKLQRLSCSKNEDPRSATMLVSLASRPDTREGLAAVFGPDLDRGLASLGLKLCAIALGVCDLYVNPATRSSSWDTCAPQVILEEAGGKLSDLRGRPLRYSSSRLRHERGLIASNGLMHEATVAELASLFPKGGRSGK